MPYKVRTRRAKRTNRRRYTRKNKKVVTQRVATTKNNTHVVLGRGFPKQMTVAHRYFETVTLTSSLGAFTNYRWSCNGMFDPNVSGGGHQPLYFDQFTPLYNHYVVIGSKVTFTVVPDPSNNISVTCGVYINDDTSTAIGDVDYAAEQNVGRQIIVNELQDKPQMFTLRWSAKKYFGGSVLANTELQGTSSSNPTEQSYYNFYLAPTNKAGTTCALLVRAHIEYIAVWKEFKDVPQS